MVDFSPLFQQTAGQFGLDPALLSRTAAIESSNNPSAVNKYGFKGLFQEGAPFVAAHGGGDPLDPASATLMAARGFAEDKAALARTLGREPTNGELYLAHQQGLGGAEKLLSNPNALASALVGNQAVLANGGSQGETAADFANHWTSRFGGQNQGQGPTAARALSQFGAVGLPSAPAAPTQPASAPAPAPPASPGQDLASSLSTLIPQAMMAMQSRAPQQAQQPAPVEQQADPRALAQSLLANTQPNLALTS